MNTQATTTQPSTVSPNRARRLGLFALGAVVLMSGLGYAGYWFHDGRYFESTDDAYVDGDVVQVTSEVPGTVLALNVDDTQTVKAGQSLLSLDPADARIAEADAEADLARAVRQVRGLFAQGQELRAQIEQREQAERTADEDLKRRSGLLADGAISSEELSHARDAVTTTRANVAAARQQLSQTVAQIDGTTIADHPQVLAAEAAVRNAALALHRTELVSPVTGVIAKRSVQVGERVAAGTPLLAVVPLDDVWVDANFKEGQLERMRAGQPVTVRTDLYGRQVTYHGHLVGIAAGSGSAFALLPAQNASGNWIKIVQRVPVRILLDPNELQAHPLRVGLSTTVRVDLHDTSGPLMTTAVRNVPIPRQASAGDDPSVDAGIASIVADNAGPKAHEPAKLSRKVQAGGGSADVGCRSVSANPAIDAPAPALAGSLKAVVAVALALGTFMQVLDTSIANVSIPTIAGNLGVSSDQGTWVITSFAVANGVSVPLTGWLMQRFGVVRTFVASVILFTIASLLCGLAWSLPSLIGFRVLQGAVSGPMIPGSQALLINVFGAAKRHVALVIWSLTTLTAPIAGPLLGGYISDNYVWPWIFLINVPVGILCGFICWTNLKNQETPTRKIPIDRVGLMLLVVWVGTLQIMLDKGKDLDWFHSTAIVIMLIVTVISFVAWLIWELTEKQPIVDLSLFKSRSFTLGTVALCLGYAVFFGNIVLMPLWLQSFVGYTATWAGLVSAPSGVTAVLTSLLVGSLIRRGRSSAARGSLICAVRDLLFHAPPSSTLTPASWRSWRRNWVQGFAMGLFFVTMLAVIFDDCRRIKIPAASGLSNFLRITASSFATSITTTLWDRREILHQSRLAEAGNVYAPAFQHSLAQMHQLGMNDQTATAAMTQGLIGQSYLLSSLDLFYLSAWLCLALIPLCFLVKRPAATGAAPVAAE